MKFFKGFGNLKEQIVSVVNLSKTYSQDITALSNLNMTVTKGDRISLLGPNGSGKSTLIRIIIGNLNQTEGKVNLFGSDISKWRAKKINNIGYVPEHIIIPKRISSIKFFKYCSALKKTRWKDAKNQISEFINVLDFKDQLTRPIGSLSAGNRQKTIILQAFIGQPELLILDEPLINLDLIKRNEAMDFIMEYTIEKSSTLIYSTHIISEVAKFLPTCYFLSNGKIKNILDLDGILKHPYSKEMENPNTQYLFLKTNKNSKVYSLFTSQNTFKFLLNNKIKVLYDNIYNGIILYSTKKIDNNKIISNLSTALEQYNIKIELFADFKDILPTILNDVLISNLDNF